MSERMRPWYIKADVGDDDQDLEQALAALAQAPRDVEGERMLAELRRSLAQVDAPPPRIGRYEVVGTLGQGAMGIVYRARDPELQREVAVKVLHGAARDGAAHDAAGALREARALARLSHPHTVTIYDVGEDRGAIFVAMELVRGQNLRDWLAAETRSPRAIWAALTDAGRGLVAAHDEGLVHGDFKPDNVLVGEDRVRVADFGLARLGAREGASEAASEGVSVDAASTAQRGGHPPAGEAQTTLGGTPAYMAPEQLEGARASAASDQFAFAVTCFEALTGERPHASESLAALHAARRAGRIDSAPLERIPARLRAPLLRALDPDPARRYPSVAALLDHLQHRFERRRLRWMLAAGLLLIALIGALVAYQQGRAHDPCGGAEARLEEVWDDSRAAGVRAAFLRTGVGRAAQAFDQTQRVIARYGRDWIAAHRRTCEATRVRGEQSDTLLDARMRCLDRRLSRLAALTQLLARVQSGAELVGARSAVGALTPPNRCLAATGVTSEQALPDDARQRAAVRALDGQLDRGWALYALGRYRDAQRLVAPIEDALKALTWPLARAKALLFVGAVQGRIGGPGQAAPRLQAALEAAGQARADRLAYAIWQRLLKDALFAGQHQRVREWSRFAKVAAARVGAPAAIIDAIVGEAELLAGRLAPALKLLRKASQDLIAAQSGIQAASDTPAASGATIAIVLSNLGNAQLQLGRVGPAEASYRAALTRAETELGRDHPTLARYIDKLGRIAQRKGDLPAALRMHRQALTMREAAFGRDDRTVASSLHELSRALLAAGRHAEAERALARALNLRERAYGANHLRLAGILETRGDAAWRARRFADARRHWQRAAAIRAKHSPAHGGVKRLACRLALTPPVPAAKTPATPATTEGAALASCH